MSNYLIETQNLGKRYGDITAVEHLSLRVAEGEIYAFLGLERGRENHHHPHAAGDDPPDRRVRPVLQTRVQLGNRQPWDRSATWWKSPTLIRS